MDDKLHSIEQAWQLVHTAGVWLELEAAKKLLAATQAIVDASIDTAELAVHGAGDFGDAVLDASEWMVRNARDLILDIERLHFKADHLQGVVDGTAAIDLEIKGKFAGHEFDVLVQYRPGAAIEVCHDLYKALMFKVQNGFASLPAADHLDSANRQARAASSYAKTVISRGDDVNGAFDDYADALIANDSAGTLAGRASDAELQQLLSTARGDMDAAHAYLARLLSLQTPPRISRDEKALHVDWSAALSTQIHPDFYDRRDIEWQVSLGTDATALVMMGIVTGDDGMYTFTNDNAALLSAPAVYGCVVGVVKLRNGRDIIEASEKPLSRTNDGVAFVVTQALDDVNFGATVRVFNVPDMQGTRIDFELALSGTSVARSWTDFQPRPAPQYLELGKIRSIESPTAATQLQWRAKVDVATWTEWQTVHPLMTPVFAPSIISVDAIAQPAKSLTIHLGAPRSQAQHLDVAVDSATNDALIASLTASIRSVLSIPCDWTAGAMLRVEVSISHSDFVAPGTYAPRSTLMVTPFASHGMAPIIPSDSVTDQGTIGQWSGFDVGAGEAWFVVGPTGYTTTHVPHVGRAGTTGQAVNGSTAAALVSYTPANRSTVYLSAFLQGGNATRHSSVWQPANGGLAGQSELWADGIMGPLRSWVALGNSAYDRGAPTAVTYYFATPKGRLGRMQVSYSWPTTDASPSFSPTFSVLPHPAHENTLSPHAGIAVLDQTNAWREWFWVTGNGDIESTITKWPGVITPAFDNMWFSRTIHSSVASTTGGLQVIKDNSLSPGTMLAWVTSSGGIAWSYRRDPGIENFNGDSMDPFHHANTSSGIVTTSGADIDTDLACGIVGNKVIIAWYGPEGLWWASLARDQLPFPGLSTWSKRLVATDVRPANVGFRQVRVANDAVYYVGEKDQLRKIAFKE